MVGIFTHPCKIIWMDRKKGHDREVREEGTTIQESSGRNKLKTIKREIPSDFVPRRHGLKTSASPSLHLDPQYPDSLVLNLNINKMSFGFIFFLLSIDSQGLNQRKRMKKNKTKKQGCIFYFTRKVLFPLPKYFHLLKLKWKIYITVMKIM